MPRDIILIGAIIGILANALKLSTNYFLYLLNYTNVVFWQITASRFLGQNDLFIPAAYLIGGIADITVTAALGVLFVTVIYFTGKRRLWIKGIGFGLFVWVSLFGTLLGQSVQAKLPQEPSGILVTIAAHFVFGLGLAGFTQLLYKTEQQTPQEIKDFNNRLFPVPAKKVFISNRKKMDIAKKKLSSSKESKLRNFLRFFTRVHR